MTTNADIETWQRLWQARSDGPDAADLRDRVFRDTRRRLMSRVGSTVVSVTVGGWTLVRAAASPGFDNSLLAIETWVFIAVVWLGVLWIDRGNSRPLSNSVLAFVDLSIRRCEAALLGLRFLAATYAAQLTFVLAWKLRFSPLTLSELITSWPVILIGWIGGPALFGFVAWYARTKRTELARLVELRRQISAPPHSVLPESRTPRG